MAVNALVEFPTMRSWFHVGFRYETKQEVQSLRSRLDTVGCEVGELDSYDDYMQVQISRSVGLRSRDVLGSSAVAVVSLNKRSVSR